MQKTHQHAAGAGVGGALGFVVVMFLPKLADITITPEEAAGLTAALGVLFSYLVKFLPRPD